VVVVDEVVVAAPVVDGAVGGADADVGTEVVVDVDGELEIEAEVVGVVTVVVLGPGAPGSAANAGPDTAIVMAAAKRPAAVMVANRCMMKPPCIPR
jgi:hypothetical protein